VGLEAVLGEAHQNLGAVVVQGGGVGGAREFLAG
jgi:hypothetical protein